MFPILHAVLDVLGLASGVLLARKSHRWSTILSLGATLTVLGPTFIHRIPVVDAFLLSSELYAETALWWYYPAGAFIAGVGIWTVRSSVWKRDFMLVMIGLFAFRIEYVVQRELTPLPHLIGTVSEEGHCPQSSTYTCTAAAASSFLHCYGISASEEEMAKLCLTRVDIGTHEAGLLRGLRRKGLSVHRIRPDRIPSPSIIGVKLLFLVDHSIAVLREEGGEYVVSDPMGGGLSRRKKDELEKVWRGSAIVAAQPR